MGKKIGDVVDVETQAGVIQYEVYWTSAVPL